MTAGEPYYLLAEEGYELGFPPSLEDYRALLAPILVSRLTETGPQPRR